MRRRLAAEWRALPLDIRAEIIGFGTLFLFIITLAP